MQYHRLAYSCLVILYRSLPLEVKALRKALIYILLNSIERGHATDCSICSDGYAEGYGFACDTCPDRERVFVLAAALAVFFLICAAAIASYTMSSPLESSGRGTIERLTRFIPLQSIKIVVVALQIVTQVRFVHK